MISPRVAVGCKDQFPMNSLSMVMQKKERENSTVLPLHAAAAEHQPATNAEHTLTNAKQQQLQPATAQEGNTTFM